MSTKTPMVRRVVSGFLLVLLPILPACHSWRPTSASPQQLIREDRPSSVRFTLMNGDTVTVENPTVRNDSIFGAGGGGEGGDGGGARVARGNGATREEAESQALEAAARRLARTRRHPVC